MKRELGVVCFIDCMYWVSLWFDVLCLFQLTEIHLSISYCNDVSFSNDCIASL
jgi:hypothetical protein